MDLLYRARSAATGATSVQWHALNLAYALRSRKILWHLGKKPLLLIQGREKKLAA